jgi:5-methylthioadenosine/S-adenosylhomocysteine deaminase
MADLVITGTLLTMDTDRTIWSDGAVVVRAGRITEVGHRSKITERHGGVKILGGPECLVTPGFINAHQHLTGDRLVRSCIPDNLVAREAIFHWAVPIHGAHTSDDDELSATLSLLEAVGNGITTTVEAGTVAHPDRVGEAFTRVGVRGCISTWGWDLADGPYAAPADEVLDRQRAVLDQFPPGGLVDGWVGLVGHDLVSDDLFVRAAGLAQSQKTGITFHLSPSPDDSEAYATRSGKRPVEHLAALGILGPHVLIAHAVHLDDNELTLLVDSDTAIAYCPWAYLRLGQGLTRAGRHMNFRERGGRLALGCDTENASDSIDALRVAALTAGLAKDAVMDPAGFGAHEALELLTIGGAEAIGMADRIGSIEVGKAADLVVHDLGGVESAPRSVDPVLQLIWAGDGRRVRDVVVDGVVVLEEGRSTRVDHRELIVDASAAQRRLLGDAGLSPSARWPIRD